MLFRPDQLRADSKARLFCFPNAGASAMIYRGWEVRAADVCPVRLPGRGDFSDAGWYGGLHAGQK